MKEVPEEIKQKIIKEAKEYSKWPESQRDFLQGACFGYTLPDESQDIDKTVEKGIVEGREEEKFYCLNDAIYGNTDFCSTQCPKCKALAEESSQPIATQKEVGEEEKKLIDIFLEYGLSDSSGEMSYKALKQIMQDIILPMQNRLEDACNASAQLDEENKRLTDELNKASDDRLKLIEQNASLRLEKDKIKKHLEHSQWSFKGSVKMYDDAKKHVSELESQLAQKDKEIERIVNDVIYELFHRSNTPYSSGFITWEKYKEANNLNKAG